MFEKGTFYRHGSQLGSTYSPTPEAMGVMMNDWYNGGWQIFANGLRRSEGAAVYGDTGYFNNIFGADIQAGMFGCKNIFGSLGQRPYDHAGTRIAYAQADIGKDEKGEFKGIGYQTVQDGKIGTSKAIPVLEVAEPYKEVPYPWDYGLGLMAVEGKDDVSSHKQYAKLIANSYSNAIDLALLRPISIKQPTQTKDLKEVETSLQGINRAISGFEEIGKENRGVAITADMVSAYGGTKSDLYDFRSAKKSPFDGQLVDAEGAALDLDHLDSLWTKCMCGWDTMADPNNKIWSVSHLAEQKISAQYRARNLYLDSVAIQRSFNGTKTVPGRDAGILVSAYHNIPLIPDPNIALDFETEMPSTSIIGDIGLYDLDHMWISTLSPVSVYTTDNIAITRELLEKSVIHSRMELRINKFIGSGRIVNVA